jgi:hypothetical protein
MKQNNAATALHFPPPFSARHTAISAPARIEIPAGAGSRRGRKSVYSEEIIETMCARIRQFGISDSAAAVSAGMSSSTISRWKQQFPELVPRLEEAREQCRMEQLKTRCDHADAEHGKGWRASARILERLFPGDYSPRMKERLAYHRLEEQRLEREECSLLGEDFEEWQREGDDAWVQLENAAEDADAQTAHRAVATTGASENHVFASESDSHNSRNSGEAGPADHPAHGAESGCRNAAQAEISFSTFESDSHNSRNSVEQEPGNPEHSRPERDAAQAEISFSTFECDSHNSRNSLEQEPGKPEHSQAERDAAQAEISFSTFESDSHNSRNSGEQEPGKPERSQPERDAAQAEISFSTFESDSQNSRNSPAGRRSRVRPPCFSRDHALGATRAWHNGRRRLRTSALPLFSGCEAPGFG